MITQTQLGLSWDDIGPAVELGARVLTDPYLPQVVDLATQIADGFTGPSGINPNEPGVGLRHLIGPLKAVVYAQKHPWAPWVAGAAVVAVPFLMGLAVSRLIWK